MERKIFLLDSFDLIFKINSQSVLSNEELIGSSVHCRLKYLKWEIFAIIFSWTLIALIMRFYCLLFCEYLNYRTKVILSLHSFLKPGEAIIDQIVEIMMSPWNVLALTWITFGLVF